MIALLGYMWCRDIVTEFHATQAVETGVKLATEASASVCGEAARNRCISNRVQSRQQMTALNKKSDYVSCD